MISNTFEDIKNSKNYYRNKLRYLTQALIIAMMLMVLLIMGLLFIFLSQPEPYYYATVSNGELVELLAVPKGTGLKVPQNS